MLTFVSTSLFFPRPFLYPQWHRIVLDESHGTRSPDSAQARLGGGWGGRGESERSGGEAGPPGGEAAGHCVTA